MANWLNKAFWSSYVLWHARREAGLPFRPLHEVLALQNRRVRAMVRHAYETVPYYRQTMNDAGLSPRDFRTADDLARLPFIHSEQLAREPARFRSRRHANGRSLQLQSSGTSGFAKQVYYDPAALFLALAQGHRQRLVLARFLGRKLGYREMDVVRSAGSSTILRRFYESYSWTPRQMDLKRCVLSADESLESGAERINAFQPDVIRGYATYIGAIFRYAHENNLPFRPPKVVCYGSDRLSDYDARLMESEFGVRVISTYQAVEALRIAFQCELCRGFHISLDNVALRVVDANGATLGPGHTGEVVISNLTNRDTVLLNYKLGDVVTLSDSACDCGRSLPVLQGIEGRSDDLVLLPEGRVTHSLAVLQELRTVPGIVQIQLVQEAPKRLSLYAVCGDGVDWSNARRDLADVLRGLFGHDAVFQVERVQRIEPEPGGKARAVISRCLPKR